MGYVRVRAIFCEVYKLQNFPFDCQDLTFVIESPDASKALLQPRFKRDDFASIDLEHFTLAEWELFPPVASFVATSSSKGRTGACRSSEFFFLVKLSSLIIQNRTCSVWNVSVGRQSAHVFLPEILLKMNCSKL